MSLPISEVQAVLLPPPMTRGLTLLIRRTLGFDAIFPTKGEGERAAALVLTALCGDGSPAFGHLRRCGADDIREACAKTKASPASVTAPKELAGLFKEITPETPVCSACGEMPLVDVGGKVQALPAGASCPYCPTGKAELVPMALKRLAWTDGRLVEPQTREDLRHRPGERIPLQDDDIVAWAGGWIDPVLERALKKSGTAVYAYLAFMSLVRNAVARLDVADLHGSVAQDLAASLLHDPRRFGLGSLKEIESALHAAKAFIADREPTNLPDVPVLALRLGRPLESLARMTVGGREYLIEGLIGRGDKADVFRGFWNNRPTEMVVIKVCRAIEDADLMAREIEVLSKLGSSQEQGAEFFVRQLPRLVSHGTISGPDGIARPVAAYRYRNRFDWTLADVLREYPEGVDPETMVWMWNRTLMLLAWVHRNDYVHGAIVPGHVLIHPLNHGAVLIDWACAVREGGRIPAISIANEAFYPEKALAGEPATAATDIAMSARCMIAVLGGNPATGDMPKSVPAPLAGILRVHGLYGMDDGTRTDDALELHDRFGDIAEGVYGPRRYHPFHLPRRSR